MKSVKINRCMRRFIKFLAEANELSIVPPTQISHGEGIPEHHRHPMGQFLQLVRSEIPYVDIDNLDEHRIYGEELGKEIDSLLDKDPAKFNSTHKYLTTDSFDGTRKEADLWDVLAHVTNQAARRTDDRYKREVYGGGLESEELSDMVKRFRTHMDERAEKIIKAQTRRNPKWNHIESLTDIKI